MRVDPCESVARLSFSIRHPTEAVLDENRRSSLLEPGALTAVPGPDPYRHRRKEQLKNLAEDELFDHECDRHRKDQPSNHCHECHQLLHMNASLRWGKLQEDVQNGCC